MWSRLLVPAVAVMLAAAGAGCGSDPARQADDELTVFAAASLTGAFTDIADAYEADGGPAVNLNVAGSSALVTQIIEGAPADVFASADLGTMQQVVDAGAVGGEPVVFTTNLGEIVVEAGNPEGITGVADLADEDLIVVQCAPEVPCGRYAAQIFQNAGVTVTPKSLEENVKAVVAKVALGEADAGIVYRTDVTAAGAAVEGVAVPAEVNVVAEYPIAAIDGAPNPDGAQAFIDFVLGPKGQEILYAYGFIAP
jgi:molybdate transport system substrate-binding protein